jgi:hypothetical protein
MAVICEDTMLPSTPVCMHVCVCVCVCVWLHVMFVHMRICQRIHVCVYGEPCKPHNYAHRMNECMYLHMHVSVHGKMCELDSYALHK